MIRYILCALVALGTAFAAPSAIAAPKDNGLKWGAIALAAHAGSSSWQSAAGYATSSNQSVAKDKAARLCEEKLAVTRCGIVTTWHTGCRYLVVGVNERPRMTGTRNVQWKKFFGHTRTDAEAACATSGLRCGKPVGGCIR